MRTPDMRGRFVGEFGSHRDPVMPQVGAHERHDLANEVIHVKLRLAPGCPFPASRECCR